MRDTIEKKAVFTKADIKSIVKGIEADYLKIIQLKPQINSDNIESILSYYRTDLSKEPQVDEILIGIKDHEADFLKEAKRLCTIGDISTISAASKAGKSMLTRTLLAPLFSSDGTTHIIENDDKIIANIGVSKGLGVLHIDTEQHQNDTLKNIHRFKKQVIALDLDKRYFHYGFRGCTPDQILTALPYLLEKYQDEICLVLIDQVADLCPDVNDMNVAHEVVTKLMAWSIKYEIHIMNIIHTNKMSDRSTGSLGSFLEKKSETLITLKKDEDNECVHVIPSYTRGESFKPFAFKIDKGTAIILHNVLVQSGSKKNKSFTPDSIPQEKVLEMLRSKFKHGKKYVNSKCNTMLQTILANSNKPSGRDKINQFKERIIELGFFTIKGKAGTRHTKYVFNDPKRI